MEDDVTKEEIKALTVKVNFYMGSMAFFEIVVVAVFSVWRDVVPLGLLVYFHLMFFATVAAWITKCIWDSEAARYTLFLVFSACFVSAFLWALVVPWVFPSVFWGTDVDLTSMHYNGFLSNSLVALIATIMLISQVFFSS